MTPQQKRVLQAARSFQGTCSADWSDSLGADGQGKILRVPARIEELAEEYGCTFECIGWRNKTKVFRLVSGPEVEVERGGREPGFAKPSPSTPSLSTDQGSLFAGIKRAKGTLGFGEEEAA